MTKDEKNKIAEVLKQQDNILNMLKGISEAFTTYGTQLNGAVDCLSSNKHSRDERGKENTDRVLDSLKSLEKYAETRDDMSIRSLDNVAKKMEEVNAVLSDVKDKVTSVLGNVKGLEARESSNTVLFSERQHNIGENIKELKNDTTECLSTLTSKIDKNKEILDTFNGRPEWPSKKDLKEHQENVETALVKVGLAEDKRSKVLKEAIKVLLPYILMILSAIAYKLSGGAISLEKPVQLTEKDNNIKD